VCVCEAEVVDDPRVYCIFFKRNSIITVLFFRASLRII